MSDLPEIARDGAWGSRALELATWARHHFVNRADAWGAYRPEEEIGREFVKPDGTKGKLGPQRTVRGRLTLPHLVRHFRATGRADVLGLHTAGADNSSKGGALDIDFHGPTSTPPEANLHAAIWWYEYLLAIRKSVLVV
jgi:hypothetical protein